MIQVICFLCGKQHGYLPSSMFNRWHKCLNCGKVYCNECGAKLKKPSPLSRERICIYCGNITILIE